MLCHALHMACYAMLRYFIPCYAMLTRKVHTHNWKGIINWPGNDPRMRWSQRRDTGRSRSVERREGGREGEKRERGREERRREGRREELREGRSKAGREGMKSAQREYDTEGEREERTEGRGHGEGEGRKRGTCAETEEGKEQRWY